MAARVTLADIAALDREMLRPVDVAPYLGVTPYWLNLTARDDPANLIFPFFLSGNRLKIPKWAFLEAMGWKGGPSGCGGS